MSRKFDRRGQVNHTVAQIVNNPRFLAPFFKPKPKWLPLFIWKGLVMFMLR